MVFVERRLHTIILNMLAPKGKRVEEKKYWPLSMDEDVKKIGKKRKKADGNTLEAGAFLSLFAKLAKAESNGEENRTG